MAVHFPRNRLSLLVFNERIQYTLLAMKGMGKLAVCLAGGLMLNISSRALDVNSSGNPYVPIVVRNVFGLNPPPTNAPPAPDDSPLKITPNGIMSIFGQLQVLYKVAPRAGQPGAKEESYCLSEGQSQDDIEVTHINEKAGIVTFNNHGTVQEIPLANAPALNTPLPGPAGPAPGQNFPMPGAIPVRFGGRPGGARFGGQAGGNNFNNGAGNNPAMGGGGMNAPAMSATPTRASSPLSVEDQELLMVAQHLKAQQDGSPMAPLFPPTRLDGPAGLGPPALPGSQ